MAAEVYEDELELTVPILEAVLPDSEQYLASAYPYPSLRATGRMESRRFRTIVLENPYLRATIIPDLGGRILRLLDKRTNTEIFPVEPLTPIERGLRGIEIPHGIQIRYTPQDRLNAMGTVNYQLVPAVEEEDDAGVWLGEVGVGLSFNALVSMPPDVCEINVELRMFNREIGNTPYNGGLAVGFAEAKSYVVKLDPSESERFGIFLHSTPRDAGLSLWSDNYMLCKGAQSKDVLSVNRLGSKSQFTLGARQLDTWKIVVSPHSGLRGTPVGARFAAVVFRKDGCRIQARKKLSNCSVQLGLADGQTMAATSPVSPEKIHEFSYKGLPASPERAAVLSGSNRVNWLGSGTTECWPLSLLKFESYERVANDDAKLRARINPMLDEGNWDFGKLLPSLRHVGFLREAMSHLKEFGPVARADEAIEQALISNGEDHLAWWAKATLKRSQGIRSDEIPELLNAHYLSPLEPVLRAESFLSQPVAQGREPNPILRPLTESPEQFVEVSCQLIDLSLASEASRFIDEALRHCDLPMLRYLQAYLLIRETSMDVEAAAHIRAASQKPFGSPLPWRATEICALESLSERFPNDRALQSYLSIATKFAK